MRAEALLVAACLAAPALAQPPAPTPAPTEAQAPAAPADLGTLFHSADERARLDKLRRGEPPEPPATRRAPPVVTGFVQRSDGRSTVWIDGRPVPVADPRAGALFDPRRVRDAPKPMPAAPAPEPPKQPDAAAPKGDAAKKPEADVKR